MTPWGVPLDQMDAALAAGRVRFVGKNRGRGRCCQCRSALPAGAGTKAYLDGHFIGHHCGPDRCTGRIRPEPPRAA